MKGSGSDLATMSAGQFTGLRLDDIRPLMERSSMTDEEMTAYLSHCMMDGKHPRPSIETLLHAFCRFRMSITPTPMQSSASAAAIMERDRRGDIRQPICMGALCQTGLCFIEDDSRRCENNPNAELVLMEKHGLVTWGKRRKKAMIRRLP
ncbi:hypothetical protein PO124_21135 [Bacillus licheniformis]|nr:hypothetical protein [Bacillus licheniformis]